MGQFHQKLLQARPQALHDPEPREEQPPAHRPLGQALGPLLPRVHPRMVSPNEKVTVHNNTDVCENRYVGGPDGSLRQKPSEADSIASCNKQRN